MKTSILSLLFSLLLPLSGMANSLALPEGTSNLTLKLEALATCNFTGMRAKVEELKDFLVVNIEVTQYTKKGCFLREPVSGDATINLSQEQLDSGKTILVQSKDSSVKLVGVEFK